MLLGPGQGLVCVHALSVHWEHNNPCREPEALSRPHTVMTVRTSAPCQGQLAL